MRRARLTLTRAMARRLPQPLLARAWHNPLFDRDWYLATYEDIQRSHTDAERHYRQHGWREGRKPNPWFDTGWYLGAYPDVARGRINPLDHYYLFGAAEGRLPSAEAASEPTAASGRAPDADHRDGATRPPERIPNGARLLLVVHDAFNHGAQNLALNVAKTLVEQFGIVPDIALLGRGVLWPQFERFGRVHDLSPGSPAAVEHVLRSLRSEGVDIAICNTTVSGALVPKLKDEGYRVITLVHELPQLIRDYGLESTATDVGRLSDAVVFASEFVKHRFEELSGSLGSRAHVRAQGLYKVPNPEDVTRLDPRRDLGLPEHARIVLAVGYADHRKGFDLFLDTFTRVRAARPDAVFAWLGCEDVALVEMGTSAAERLGFGDSLRLLPRVPDVARYYAAADVLLLPSREDPFPSVALEAMSHGVPIVAFEGATGSETMLKRGAGILVPNLDVDAMAAVVVRLLDDPDERLAMSATALRIVAEEHRWVDYVRYLLELAGVRPPDVSVVVPNYNYERYLEQRLESVFGQTYPVHEVIVLDDASTDQSLELLARLQSERGWNFSTDAREENSGSVFRQWCRGVAQATGDLVWIAEADDFAEAQLLTRLVPLFADPAVVIAYCESRRVDQDGVVDAESYLAYVSDIDPAKWTASWVRDGPDELAESLAIRNTIPNVSAVLFRRQHLLDVLESHLDAITDLRVAGDYAVYAWLLHRPGKVAFVAEPLNNHRRHASGVTIDSYGPIVVNEVAQVQKLVRSLVSVTPAVRRHADRYLHELCDQFELPEVARQELGIGTRDGALTR